ncbi:hypothetical protein GCM10009555_057920 [Acrocarpospora macrocephala]|uniref:Uncharacterized protein n=1 Tax=Acrocarpospora macrocephala TaxID=150177 RepID=A0A5M3WGQ9_9ACTN|nr:hypothetical protein Amac_019210 [Acrocarpospora macrocephala]
MLHAIVASTVISERGAEVQAAQRVDPDVETVACTIVEPTPAHCRRHRHGSRAARPSARSVSQRPGSVVIGTDAHPIDFT